MDQVVDRVTKRVWLVRIQICDGLENVGFGQKLGGVGNGEWGRRIHTHDTRYMRTTVLALVREDGGGAIAMD